ncbi:hypothetical protein ACFL7M_15300 [Thermodesulfobacteriota bacterium]
MEEQGNEYLWELVKPDGVTNIEPMKLNPHPSTLEGKTIVLRANGKHNSDSFLNRIGELFTENVDKIKLIKAWEILPETNISSFGQKRSEEIANEIAALKPDIVISSSAD